MNKRGQFYLIAAVIIVGIIFGFATITNKVNKTHLDKSRIYNMLNELNLTSEDVLNCSTFRGESEDKQKEMVEAFTEKYSVYLQGNEKVYFILKGLTDDIAFSYDYTTLQKDIGYANNIITIEGVTYTLDTVNYLLIFLEKNKEQYSIKG